MLDLTPEPDGRVAIYEDGELLGRARDQAHADDWSARWEANQPALGKLAWDIAEVFWESWTPEQRRAWTLAAEADARARQAA